MKTHAALLAVVSLTLIGQSAIASDVSEDVAVPADRYQAEIQAVAKSPYRMVATHQGAGLEFSFIDAKNATLTHTYRVSDEVIANLHPHLYGTAAFGEGALIAGAFGFGVGEAATLFLAAGSGISAIVGVFAGITSASLATPAVVSVPPIGKYSPSALLIHAGNDSTMLEIDQSRSTYQMRFSSEKKLAQFEDQVADLAKQN